jgi:hypothetical protein
VVQIINKMDNQPNKTQHNKKALINALEKSLGVVTSACKSVGLNRSTYYDYYNSDPEFKKSVDELSNIALDFAESNLHKQIKDGNTSATIFYLKTKGKRRGYVERQEITGIEGTKLFEVEILKNDKEDTE